MYQNEEDMLGEGIDNVVDIIEDVSFFVPVGSRIPFYISDTLKKIAKRLRAKTESTRVKGAVALQSLNQTLTQSQKSKINQQYPWYSRVAAMGLKILSIPALAIGNFINRFIPPEDEDESNKEAMQGFSRLENARAGYNVAHDVYNVYQRRQAIGNTLAPVAALLPAAGGAVAHYVHDHIPRHH